MACHTQGANSDEAQETQTLAVFSPPGTHMCQKGIGAGPKGTSQPSGMAKKSVMAAIAESVDTTPDPPMSWSFALGL